MVFLQLENALNILAGYSSVDGPLHGYAEALKTILCNDNMSGEGKARKLRLLILDCLQDWNSKGELDFMVVTPKEMAQALNKSEKTIIRMCQDGEIKNARRVGSGKNSKWVIILKKKV